jgi:late competence protein required for DNA uptake (superfamily II DNA/RNA helicase)
MREELLEQLEKQSYQSDEIIGEIIETFKCAGCNQRVNVYDLWEAGNGKLYCSTCGSEQDAI